MLFRSVLSQKGALDRFVVKESEINSENQTPAADVDDGRGDDEVEVEAHSAEFDEGDERHDANTGDGHDDANIDGEGNNANIDVEVSDGTVSGDIDSSFHHDMFDPIYWDGLDGEEAAHTHEIKPAEKHKDIDGEELCKELMFIRDLLEKSMGPLDILKFLEKRPFYPFANIAYRILLTIPVTVASAERSFSKLKLLKSYMRSTMTQERLSGLATIALENDFLEKIDYKDMIEDFISRNTRRMMLFGRT